MSKFFGDHKLTLTCVKCGRKFQKTIARLETSPKLPCPRCRTVTHYDARELRSGLKEADKSIDDFVKSLRKFGKS